jgi:hypothetical protein
MIEIDVQNTIRLEAARIGMMLWRNNTGCLNDVSGRLVRFGLGNDSPRTNKILKSSDLIGLWNVTGQFVAIEVKHSDWEFKGGERETAQLNFINIVKKFGGIALFATCWNDVLKELHRNDKNVAPEFEA